MIFIIFVIMQNTLYKKELLHKNRTLFKFFISKQMII